MVVTPSAPRQKVPVELGKLMSVIAGDHAGLVGRVLAIEVGLEDSREHVLIRTQLGERLWVGRDQVANV